MGACYDPAGDLAVLAGMEMERDALGRFLSDRPVYSVALLQGTAFEGVESFSAEDFWRMFNCEPPRYC
jgi:hypothetical protein